ncbi:MAG: hypothetical protein ACLGH4_09010 [Actinomycetes bacterium]
MTGDYSQVAAQQLDELESSAPDDLWDAVLFWSLDAGAPRVEAVFPHP